MLRFIFTVVVAVILWMDFSSFCGFYVAGAGAKLYNKSSQVIIARDGQRTVVTMESDYSGEVKQFAMVVPVPSVLKRDQIRVVNSPIFEVLDQYSAPRLVEYYDENPCLRERFGWSNKKAEEASACDSVDSGTSNAKENRVKIEARYEIGEYSILILSANESDGLTSWLKDNGYAIPEKANEVLTPYIRNKLKFFVVKVNLNRFNRNGMNKLRPIQITYDYDKFMLPIRLGMANAESAQDLTVYAFSRKGRIECSNYRTIEMPTDEKIPLRVKDEFPKFYQACFSRQYQKANKAGVFLEYGWDISSTNYLMCDPCPSEPPKYENLKEAGVFWVEKAGGDPYGQNADYQGEVYITRLHVRYDRPNFPDDLMFSLTPDKSQYQVRYIVTHDATGDFDCYEAHGYFDEVDNRKEEEEENLTELTGWAYSEPKPTVRPANLPMMPDLTPRKGSDWSWIVIGLMALGLIFIGTQIPKIWRLIHRLMEKNRSDKDDTPNFP